MRKVNPRGSTLRPIPIVVTLIAVCALVTSAWGASGPRSASTSGRANACVSEARAAVVKAMARVVPPVPGPKIDVSKNAGKSVWLILPRVNPLTSAVASGFRGGAKLAGLESHVFEGVGSVNSFNDGVSQAVAQNASVIILYGINPALVSLPLGQAVARGIKIIDAVVGNPTDPLPAGVYAHVSANFTRDGALLADYILSVSNCKANAAVFRASVLPVHVNQEKGFTNELARLCPSCKSYVDNVDLTTTTTALMPQVATFLQRQSDVNYIFAVSDQFVPFVEGAIKQVSPSVKIVSHDGVAAQLDGIRSGTGAHIADVSFPPIPWIGWTLIDTVERAMLGMRPGNTRIPSLLITKENVGTKNYTLFPAFQKLRAIFAQAWGKK